MKNEDPAKLRNGVLNVYSKGIQQVQREEFERKTNSDGK